MNTLIVYTAQYLVIVSGLIAVIAAIYSGKVVRNNIIKLAILSLIIAFLFAFVAGELYYDSRPFASGDIEPLFPHHADNGFPSDHTLIAMVISSTIFVFRHRLGVVLGLLGILVGISRVLANVHHPIDIIGSIFIAIIATYIAWLVMRKIDKNFKTTIF